MIHCLYVTVPFTIQKHFLLDQPFCYVSSHRSNYEINICVKQFERDHMCKTIELFQQDIIIKLRERGYHPAKIRKILKSCKIQYKDRLIYLEKIRSNYNDKLIKNIVKNKHDLSWTGMRELYDDFGWIQVEKKVAIMMETDSKRIYLKKRSNRLFDKDWMISKALRELNSDLNIESLDLMLCNSVGIKLGYLIFR
eukprot:304727_1